VTSVSNRHPTYVQCPRKVLIKNTAVPFDSVDGSLPNSPSFTYFIAPICACLTADCQDCRPDITPVKTRNQVAVSRQFGSQGNQYGAYRRHFVALRSHCQAPIRCHARSRSKRHFEPENGLRYHASIYRLSKTHGICKAKQQEILSMVDLPVLEVWSYNMVL
jgi:hypothetical protein